MLSNEFSSLFQDQFISDYLQKNRVIVMPSISKSLNSLLLINLQQLPQSPVNFAEILIRWIISVNRKRIENGEEIIITYDIVKRCPIWKIIDMPMKRVTMSKRTVNRPYGPTPTRKQSKLGSINKKSNKK